MDIDPWNPDLAAFFGFFTSEGTLTNQLSLKVTSKDLEFLKETTKFLRNVFGDLSSTKSPPTKEHKHIDDGYHKYYSKKIAEFLVSNYNVKPGRKVLTNSGLPYFFMASLKNKHNMEKAKIWLKNYLQMRYSGDGHIDAHLDKKVTRRIILTRNIALCNLDEETIKKIKDEYYTKKPIKEYDEGLVNVLQTKAHNETNYPNEFIDIKYALQELFSIYTTVNCYGIRSIYFDKKLERHLITAVYRLVITRKHDVIGFANNIGF